MWLSGGSGQVGLRVVSNHHTAIALHVPRPHDGAMKCHMGVSLAVFGTCTMLEFLPADQVVMPRTVRSALCNDRGMGEDYGMFGHKRCVIVMLPGLFICPGNSGTSRPPHVSPPSFISSCTELTVLWGMSES